MRPYYQDDLVTLYHGDCMAVLPSLAGAQLVLTDVPYGEVNEKNAGKKSYGLRKLDKGHADAETFALEPFVDAVVAACDGSFYVFCGWEQITPLMSAFERYGLTKRLGVWRKTNPSPMNGERLWLSALEACVFARKEGAVFNEHCKPAVWEAPAGTSDYHPTEKPRQLFDRLLLASSDPGGLVLDPCAGSGTALVAAKNLGRRAIGIELREDYCAIAAQRLSQNVLDLGGAA